MNCNWCKNSCPSFSIFIVDGCERMLNSKVRSTTENGFTGASFGIRATSSRPASASLSRNFTCAPAVTASPAVRAQCRTAPVQVPGELAAIEIPTTFIGPSIRPASFIISHFPGTIKKTFFIIYRIVRTRTEVTRTSRVCPWTPNSPVKSTSYAPAWPICPAWTGSCSASIHCSSWSLEFTGFSRFFIFHPFT